MLQGHMFFLFLVEVVQFTGVLANGFIMVVNAIDLITRRKMAPLDLLLSCLATSRIILLTCVFFGQLAVFCLMKYSLFTDCVVFVLFINELSLWLATWLSVFYCAKIATISHPFFLWLKMRISRLVPWLILGSVFHAATIALIHGRETAMIPKQVFKHIFSENATQVRQIHVMPLSVFILGVTLPSFIFIVAVLLLIFSLCNHCWQMRNMEGTREPSRHGHIGAMLSILSFFILYFSHYLVAIVVFAHGLPLGNVNFLFCTLVVGIYPSLHSVILILGNPKLKQNAKTFIVHCKCCHCVRA
ncbi:taste receptor type 2 member 1 [Mesocricetus auratus]|uniref:Taste receptor type 2 n=1 Tax=Mesocricetus auratus TaxID=10036 RepID=A0A1U8CIT6_MESAU|nr:taste receptor type 2 member 1 [Mesocricetus auratus]